MTTLGVLTATAAEALLGDVATQGTVVLPGTSNSTAVCEATAGGVPSGGCCDPGFRGGGDSCAAVAGAAVAAATSGGVLALGGVLVRDSVWWAVEATPRCFRVQGARDAVFVPPPPPPLILCNYSGPHSRRTIPMYCGAWAWSYWCWSWCSKVRANVGGAPWLGVGGAGLARCIVVTRAASWTVFCLPLSPPPPLPPPPPPSTALLGVVQNHARKVHGSHPNEALFYTHALGLPLFLSLSSNVLGHAQQWSSSPPLGDVWPWGPVPPSPLADVPVQWVLLVCNVLSQ